MNHGNQWRRYHFPLVAMELLLLNPAKNAPVEIFTTQRKGHDDNSIYIPEPDG